MAFSATWEGAGQPADARVRRVRGAAGRTEPLRLPGQRALPAGCVGRSATHRRATLSPGYCPLSMLFSDWDGSGRRDLRISNDRQYYDNDDGRRAAVAVRAGRGAARPTRRPTAGRSCGCGAWASPSYDVTGDGYPEVYLTSQGANTLQTLVVGTVRSPPTMTWRSSTTSRRRGRSSGATPCRRRPGIRSSRT